MPIQRILFSILVAFTLSARAAEKPNVLFIPVDDLNHWVGHLARNKQTKTPNIDRLAAMGVTFTNAHCAAPLCNPSRAALLSGLRPNTTGIYDNDVHFSKGAGISAAGSLVTQFKNASYETLGIGKLWHGGLGFPQQWSATGGRTRAIRAPLEKRNIGGIAFGILDGGDETVADTAIADYAIAELGKKHDRPFFLVPGFHKPHMPWNVPRKYYDLHPLESIELPPIKADDLADIPAAGIKMARPDGDHARVLASGRWKEAIQGYLAAISYVDAQIGRILDALEKSEYRNNTIICFWGDHGWHLGEKEHWRKFTLWEEATRAPFIWVVPGVTKAGGVCERSVDFMSIYPTLCDLAGIPRPAHVVGENIRPLLIDPKAEWNKPALTTFGQNNHAIRTEEWRYIRYADGSEELYDHRSDPYEWSNLALQPDYSAKKKELAAFLPSDNVPAVKGSGDIEGEENAGDPREQPAQGRARRQAAKPVPSAK